MLDDAQIMAVIAGALGGFLGSAGHVLSDSKLRKELLGYHIPPRDMLINVMVWFIVAMLAGAMTGLEYPIVGFFAGLLTGFLGSETMRKTLFLLNEEERLKEIIRLNVGQRSLNAMKQLLERRPFIEGVDIKEFVSKLEITIIPTSVWNPEKHMKIISDLIMPFKPIGVAYDLKEPVQTLVNITGSITIRNGKDETAVLAAAQQVIRNFINSHTLGEPVRLARLVAIMLVEKAIPGVIDLDVMANNQAKILPVPVDQVARCSDIKLSLLRADY